MLGRIPTLDRESKYRRKLEKLLGFTPDNVRLYRQAFTHKSHTEHTHHFYSNERLEFLGDAVLSLVIGEYLFRKYPDQNEGFMSQLRAKVVNREFFNNLGYKLGLDLWLLRSASLEKEGDVSPTLVGNVFEALFGAIFLDKGYKMCLRFFERVVLVHHLDLDSLQRSVSNYKSILLEWAQKNGHSVEFRIASTGREGYALIFHIDCMVDGIACGHGSEVKKKKAEQQAAKEALEFWEIKQRSAEA